MSLFQGARSVTAAVLSVSMLAALAACGTSDSATTSADGSSKSSSASTSDPLWLDVSSIKKDDAIAALLPDSVTADGTLTVGADTADPPSQFLADDGKTPTGFSVDLSRAMAAVLGLKEQTISSTFDSIIPSAGSKYDIGISSFTITKERMKAVDFVTYYQAGTTWVVRKGNPDKVDSSNLCGVKVAVQTGTMQERMINEASDQCKAKGKEPVDLQSSKLQTDVTTAVVSGKASAAASDSPVAGYAITQTDGQLEALGDDINVTPEGIVVKKGDTGTAKALQQALQKLIDDGTYMKILKHWGVESGAISKVEINPDVAA